MDTISGLQIPSMFCTGALLSSNEKKVIFLVYFLRENNLVLSVRGLGNGKHSFQIFAITARVKFPRLS